MAILLKDVITKEHGKMSSSSLAKKAQLPRSTVADALSRPIGRTSFEVIVKLLNATSIPVELVISKYLEKKISPAEEEVRFLNESDLDTLTIMGVTFSNQTNFWKTRDSILNSIYEGAHPSQEDVMDAYRQLEEHVPTDQLISELTDKYRGR
ncbi:MAG: winged helix-turn-helix domain-containing protein [Lentilactobacillus diolivorans]|jgi:lambda repressor-like predicted transcriptional regulator|nr:winged helix-turn-helix domain-containing protein [Lentilactobacillus diolivorans]RRG03174.1 MAG: winged helix-turn-helix domain-containing protein [Lactobacillus sp.]